MQGRDYKKKLTVV